MRARAWAVVVSTGLWAASAAWAGPGMGSPQPQGPDFSAAYKGLAFTATGHVTTSGRSKKDGTQMEMAFAVLEGKSRVEMDMAKMKGAGVEGSIEQMKQMGMDRTVMISLPSEGKTIMAYPGAGGYCEMPIAGADPKGKGKEPKVEKKEVGKETIDGHSCVKFEMTVTVDGSKPVKSTVWEATDLKGFPIQCQMESGGMTTTMLYKDIKMGKPDAKLFEPPAGCKKYGSMQEMMMSIAMKRMPK